MKKKYIISRLLFSLLTIVTCNNLKASEEDSERSKLVSLFENVSRNPELTDEEILKKMQNITSADSSEKREGLGKASIGSRELTDEEILKKVRSMKVLTDKGDESVKWFNKESLRGENLNKAGKICWEEYTITNRDHAIPLIKELKELLDMTGDVERFLKMTNDEEVQAEANRVKARLAYFQGAVDYFQKRVDRSKGVRSPFDEG